MRVGRQIKTATVISPLSGKRQTISQHIMDRICCQIKDFHLYGFPHSYRAQLTVVSLKDI